MKQALNPSSIVDRNVLNWKIMVKNAKIRTYQSALVSLIVISVSVCNSKINLNTRIISF